MNPEALPPDLRKLEAQLARRPRPEPAPELRARILSAAGEPPPCRSRGWQLLAAAAVVVLVLNIGLSIINGVRFDRLAASTEIEGPVAPPGPDSPEMDDPFRRYAANALASLPLSAGPGS